MDYNDYDAIKALICSEPYIKEDNKLIFNNLSKNIGEIIINIVLKNVNINRLFTELRNRGCKGNIVSVYDDCEIKL